MADVPDYAMEATKAGIAAVGKPLAELIPKLYDDLAKPGVAQLGKLLGTLGATANLVLAPFSFAAQAGDLYVKHGIDMLRRRLENVAVDDVVGPVPEIAVPVLQRLTYLRDEQLADLYAGLLASASSRQLAGAAHPRFIQIIEALSPDEALLLPIIRTIVPCASSYMRVSEFRRVVDRDQTLLAEASGLQQPRSVQMYLKNLQALGLVEFDYGAVSGFRPAEAQYRQIEAEITTRHAPVQMEIERGTVSMTFFGTTFMRGVGR